MDDLRVTLIQSDIHWESIDANLAMFEEKIWGVEEETDLIVLPEMFSTGFSMDVKNLAEPMNSKTFRWMKQLAEQKKAMIMGSYIVKDSGSYFNRLIAMKPEGSYEQYDKKHLFGLGGEDRDFDRGESRTIVSWKGWKILPLICYDLRFPVWARSVGSGNDLYEYDLVVFIASWPKPRINAWDTLLKARAIENLSFSVGVNRLGKDGAGLEYVGHSVVNDYLGKEIGNLGEKENHLTATLTSEGLKKYRKNFPFQEDADPFIFS